MLVMKKDFYEYKELKEIVNSLGINSKDEYIRKHKTIVSLNGKKAPVSPSTFYGNEIWENWSVFLNKPIHAKKLNNIYYSYEECRGKMVELGITSKSVFTNNIKHIMQTDVKIPYSPYKIYDTEWKGWGHFLSTYRVQDNLKEYRPFQEAREWARSLNLKMHKEWRLLELDKLPNGIPKKPEKTYKNKGWVSYSDWLGIDETHRISYGEKIIFDILNENNISFIYDRSVLDCRKESKLRFDFYIPSKNICIEFDGIQHFKSVDFFGGEEEFEKTRMRDEIKNKFCILNNIKLLRIPYTMKKNEIEDYILSEIKKGG